MIFVKIIERNIQTTMNIIFLKYNILKKNKIIRDQNESITNV